MIEHSPGVQRELRALITRHFCFDEYLASSSVDEAIEIAAIAQPALIIYDLPITGFLDGQVIQKIRAVLPEAAIIAISLYDNYRAAAIRAGADAFVSKTEPRQMLLDAIRSLGGPKRVGS